MGPSQPARRVPHDRGRRQPAIRPDYPQLYRMRVGLDANPAAEAPQTSECPPGLSKPTHRTSAKVSPDQRERSNRDPTKSPTIAARMGPPFEASTPPTGIDPAGPPPWETSRSSSDPKGRGRASEPAPAVPPAW